MPNLNLNKTQWQAIQEALLQVGCTSNGQLVADGDPGENTGFAIAEFQNGVGALANVTGELDRDTLGELMNQVPSLFDEERDDPNFLDGVFGVEPTASMVASSVTKGTGTVDIDVEVDPAHIDDDLEVTQVTPAPGADPAGGTVLVREPNGEGSEHRDPDDGDEALQPVDGDD